MSEATTTEVRRAFSIVTGVEVNVRASAERLWALLTDAAGFPSWNGTVSRIEGEIREGGHLRIHVPGSSRTFAPTVLGVVPNRRMIWAGGVSLLFKGVRTFELRPQADGSTDFSMVERFAGLMLPIAGRALPDFRPIFARYASDLKRAAEE